VINEPFGHLESPNCQCQRANIAAESGGNCICNFIQSLGI
jgi:hypothetical protein